MRTQIKYLLNCCVIFSMIFFALIPVVLSNNYIRQDDLMWEIWPWMKISDFGYLYYNTVFQLVRPICMISFYLTDLVSINIQGAVYVRLICIVLIGMCGILLYFWQLKFNKNKLIAGTFAICVFTLPPYQIFAATGNYSLIITALVMTFIAAFCWYHAFFNIHADKSKRLFYIGCGFFFASLLDYPLSSMFVWALLAIAWLNTLSPNAIELTEKRRFIITTAITTIGFMVFYYLFSRLIHVIFHVNLANGRTATIDSAHLIPRLFRIFDVLGWHSEFWIWNNPTSLKNSLAPCILLAFTLGLISINYQNGIKKLSAQLASLIKSTIVLFLFFFLAYSPIMATNELIITYRYALVTMPILLYTVVWSAQQLINFTNTTNPALAFILFKLFYMSLVAMTFFGIFTANVMLADGIVGPHENDFLFIQQELASKVIPHLKKQEKVLIHAIACDDNVNRYSPGVPTSFEYGMRTCQYQQQVIGVIIHSLYKMGYPSNFNRHNDVIYGDNEIAVKDTPWGTLVVNSPINPGLNNKLYDINNTLTIVTIDTRNTIPYKHFDFYRNLFRKFYNAKNIWLMH